MVIKLSLMVMLKFYKKIRHELIEWRRERGLVIEGKGQGLERRLEYPY